MADIGSKADLLRAGYGGYAGWGETEALADFKATGGQGKYDPGSASVPGNTSYSSSYSGGGDTASLIAQAQKLLSESKQPSIAALEASKGIAQKNYELGAANLKEQSANLNTKYENLLADIAGKEKTAVESATKITADELGARGIAPGSTFYEQNIQGAQQPIRSEYAGFTRDVGLAQKEGATTLAGLGNELTINQQKSLNDIDQAIAAIQSATTTEAVDLALKQYQIAQDNYQFEENKKLQEKQLELTEKNNQLNNQFLTLGEGQTVYDPTTGQVLYKTDKTYAPEKESGNPFQQLIEVFGKDRAAQIIGVDTTAGTVSKPGTFFGSLELSGNQGVGNSTWQ